MPIKLRDLREDGWLGILAVIRGGGHPQRENIIAALRRQEPYIPGEVQIYLADLLDRGLKRGRPKIDPLLREIREAELVLRVTYWRRVLCDHVRDPERQAFSRVAQERKWKNVAVAERKYWAAVKFLRAQDYRNRASPGAAALAAADALGDTDPDEK